MERKIATVITNSYRTEVGEMSKRLELIFKNEGDKNVTISIDDPVEPVDPQAVSSVMDTIIENDVFTSHYGGLVSKHAARIVERNVEEIEIEM